jgi:phage portal protein BeeE
LSVSLDKDVSLAAFKAFVSAAEEKHAGPDNAGKTMYLGGGADVKVIGSSFQDMDLKHIQGAGETRIAAAGGVPPIIVGLSEGLESATYSNYALARRRFADGTMHPLWQNVAGCFANIVHLPVPPNGPAPNVRLWYDSRDVPFLREDRTDVAQIQSTQASAINTLITAGFTAESAVKAVIAEDFSLLVWSGLVSVQLQPPGSTVNNPAASASAAAAPSNPEVTGAGQ